MDWREIGIIPLTDAAGITKNFNAQSHRGLDIGWYANRYCPVLAWQDGTLIAKGYSGQVGYWLVMEHEYDDGKRWVGYIHLYSAVSAAIGSKWKMGQQIGNATRGNTGYSNGPHLHIYMTEILDKAEKFVWNSTEDPWTKHAIDPLPHLYYDKKYNTEFISPVWARPLPEHEDDYEKLYKEEKEKNKLLTVELEKAQAKLDCIRDIVTK